MLDSTLRMGHEKQLFYLYLYLFLAHAKQLNITFYCRTTYDNPMLLLMSYSQSAGRGKYNTFVYVFVVSCWCMRVVYNIHA